MKNFLAICISAVIIGFAIAFALGKFPRLESSARSGAPWDSNAISSTFAGFQVREVNPANATLILFYDVQNNTDHDYQLANGADTVIMGRLKSDSSLIAEEQIKLNNPAFVPAKNRTRISLGATHPFEWPEQMDSPAQSTVRGFVAREVGNLDGLVLFDSANRYQIELPGAWQQLREVPAASTPR
ncbi:MAG: hypothetical protein WBC04_01695 [Candidatus Acidiferrales bacterium]